MTTETKPTYDELVATVAQLQRKLGDIEQRVEQVEISENRVDRVSDLLHETSEDRDRREGDNAEPKARAAARANALGHCVTELRLVEPRRDRLASLIQTGQSWRRKCKDALRELDARKPDTAISLAYDAWQQERAPWAEALEEVEHGVQPDFESELVAEWRREANIRPTYPGDRWPYLGLRVLRRLLADEDAQINRIEQQAQRSGLTMADLRTAITA